MNAFGYWACHRCHHLHCSMGPGDTQLVSERPGILTPTPGLGGHLLVWVKCDELFMLALRALPPQTSFHHSGLHAVLVFPPPGDPWAPGRPSTASLLKRLQSGNPSCFFTQLPPPYSQAPHPSSSGLPNHLVFGGFASLCLNVATSPGIQAQPVVFM